MANKDIREAAKTAGVRLWQIANKLKVSEATITRLLRIELSAEKKVEFLKIIDELKGAE